jgi:hypothetical protein
MLLTPLRLSTGTLRVMAFFRAHDAAVTLGKALEAGIAVALVKTLGGFAAAVDAIDHTVVLQFEDLPQILIERNLVVVKQHGVLYRVG